MEIETELGIDEAGRGPVLGPMILAGVWVPRAGKQRLIDWGVQDSKKFGSHASGKHRRKMLADAIKAEFAHEIVVLEVETIDRFVRQHGLNRLEQESARHIIERYPATDVILDGARLFGPLADKTTRAVDRADNDYISVAAASILAKNKRDDAFEALCRPYRQSFGEVRGGGYANHQTLAFVKWHLKIYRDLPPFFRRSYAWKALDDVYRPS